MSIESTPSINTDVDPYEVPRYVILWFWKEKPGGGLADWFYDISEADSAFEVLSAHGDPSKDFKMLVI